MKQIEEIKKRTGLISIGIGILIGLVLKFFIIDTVFVSGNSMHPVLTDGQLVILNKAAYGLVIPFTSEHLFRWRSPQTNDIIYYLHDNKMVIKRCVGVEHEALSFYSNNGYYVTIDNNTERTIPLDEKQYQRLKNAHTVPSGYIFAVGDNYSESVDSRDYGFVFASHVPGKVVCSR